MQNDPILKELQDQLKKIETETKEMVEIWIIKLITIILAKSGK